MSPVFFICRGGESMKEVLQYLSLRNSLGVRLRDVSVCDLDSSMIGKIYDDLIEVEKRAIVLCGVAPFRVKTPQSFRKKVEKYKDRDKSLLVCCNDFIGCRFIVDSYPNITETEKISIFMRNKESGYKALHVSYQFDDYCYPIEIQFWLKEDVDFNSWSRKYAYKLGVSDSVMSSVRQLYDAGEIQSEEDFVRCLHQLSV